MTEATQNAKGITRRELLKGAAVGATALGAGAMLESCSPQQAATPPAAGTAAPVKYSFEVAPAPIAKGDIKQSEDADVVVIGAGVSGLMAALSAAEAGAKTILIEKSAKFNARGGHNAAINSKIQQSEGLKYTPGQVARDLVRSYGNRVDSQLVMLWAENVSPIMDYLIDLAAKYKIQVLRWGNDVPTAYYPEYKTVHMFGAMDETIMAGMLEKEAIAKGAIIHYSMAAAQLVRPQNAGRVTGVIAGAAGNYTQFNAANAVIVATGDYGHNPEMIQAWCPAAANVDGNVYSPPVNTGDGQKMGLWVGGAIHPEHVPMIHNLGAAPFSGNPFLRVNVLGERYENEDVPIPSMANSIQLQPQRKTWTIYDSTFVDDLPKAGLSFSRVNAMSDMTQQAMDAALKQGDSALIKADTLDDMAKRMGVPVEAFKATVARYNALTQKGSDDDFGKNPDMLSMIDTPPFYAAFNSIVLLVTLGGLKVNTKLQVLDANDTVIPGLYASGNAAGGFFARDYPVIVPGQSHSRAWTTGRLAGQNAAADKGSGA